jgi:putative ABC transport system substrate-binding protein
MRRSTIGLLLTLALGILWAPVISAAQQPAKVSHIGVLSPGPPPPVPDPVLDAFRQGLCDLGYVEGQPLVIERRYAAGNPERLRDLAAELVRLPVAVLVAWGLTAARAAQEATSTIPIVFTGGADPVRQGLVSSLAQPGGNITGVTAMRQDLNAKRLEILKEAIPHAARIAVLTNPATPVHEADLQDLGVTSRVLGVAFHVLEVRRADDLEDAFTAMTRVGADALLVLAEPLLIDHLSGRIADLAATHRLPTMYNWKRSVEAGGLMAYGPSNTGMAQRAAHYVDRILNGAKPADLPVEQPTKFEFVINLKTAKALGLTIPPTIHLQADAVIR